MSGPDFPAGMSRRAVLRVGIVVVAVLTIMVVLASSLTGNAPNVKWEAEGFAPREWVGPIAPASGERGDRWVVITTIQEPTPQLHTLSKMEGWKTVVVGDKKTPPGWSLPGVVYLGLEDQEKLNYRICARTPLNSYARKNIGYLYAIQHGAQVVYETDDDNVPLDVPPAGALNEGAKAPVPVLSDPHDLPVYAARNSTCVNPYAHFGAPDVWPRGFPLELVSDVRVNPADPDPPVSVRPFIQQGLADLDPDVDAIFRLLNTDRVGNVRFDGQQPPIALPKGTISPYNTQNTIVLREAFWALVLPSTTPFRVCDIWRGYWAQTLLWQIGGNLVFMPPTAVQERNAHNYLLDFIDEWQLYTLAGKLVDHVLEWKPKGATVLEQAVDLAWKMVDAGYWGHNDGLLIEAWMKDLVEVGYEPPPLMTG